MENFKEPVQEPARKCAPLSSAFGLPASLHGGAGPPDNLSATSLAVFEWVTV